MNRGQTRAVRIQHAVFELEQARRAFAELERICVERRSDDQMAKHFARKRIQDAEHRLDWLRHS
jgi:hypothetical protein